MPLSPEQVAIVKSTVPIIREHGTTITKTFYRNMLAAHPELNNYFSVRNQQNGAQQTALAQAVFAYAAHIDDLGKLTEAVERIAHKHVSLFIKPEHYPIVGKYLVGAFAEVLGDGLTPEVADAWIAAYGQLADIFIQRERQLYAEAGDWQTWRKFKIAKKEAESEGVTSFYIKPSDHEPLPPFLPGQYVSVQVPVPELGVVQSRQFSLSEAPETGADHYRITVKRESAQGAHEQADILSGKYPGLVSGILHEKYQVGDEVEVSPPRGLFIFEESKRPTASPVLLLSAGVGATPVMSILETVLRSPNQSRPVRWIHAARHSGAVCYGRYIREAAKQHENLRADIFIGKVGEGDRIGREYDHEGYLSLDKLEEENALHLDDKTAEYFVCGPEPWMILTRDALERKGIEESRIHLELFRTGKL